MQTDRTRRGYGVGPDNAEFEWGPIFGIHTIGDISIVEFEAQRASNVTEDDWQPHRQFSLYIYVKTPNFRWRRTGHSFYSLDEALLAGLAWKYEMRKGWDTAANSRAWIYMRRMIGMGA